MVLERIMVEKYSLSKFTLKECSILDKDDCFGPQVNGNEEAAELQNICKKKAGKLQVGAAHQNNKLTLRKNTEKRGE